MSAPSGKPFEPIKISDFAPKRVRDQLAAADERNGREGPDFSPARPANAPEGPFAAHPGTGAETDRTARDANGDTRHEQHLQHRIAARDADLERLRATLSAALAGEVNQKQGRLPSAPQLPRVPGLGPPTESLRLPRSLKSAYRAPASQREETKILGIVLAAIVGACAVAAPIAYFALDHHGATNEPLAITPAPKMSTLDTQIAALPPMPAVQPEAPPPPPPVQVTKQPPPQPPPSPAADRYRLQSAAPDAPASRDTTRVATAPDNPPPLSAAPSVPSEDVSPAPSASTSDRAATKIAPGEIAMLLKQGEQFLSAGDVATARVLFGRAAEAGDGNAAWALGATYDPAVLGRLRVRGIAPDSQQAQRWYQKAREYGSPASPAWLAKLAGR
jgi:hypothetical protein